MALPLRLLIGLLVASLPAVASAEIVWQVGKRGGHAYLQAMSTEPERDTEFWARCRPDGTIDIGVGADSGVGAGKGGAVALILKSGGVMAKLSGLSRDSGNFQMTGGTELRARVSRNAAVFKVLGTGKPIQVSGAIKPLSWPATGLGAKVATFLKACQ